MHFYCLANCTIDWLAHWPKRTTQLHIISLSNKAMKEMINFVHSSKPPHLWIFFYPCRVNHPILQSWSSLKPPYLQSLTSIRGNHFFYGVCHPCGVNYPIYGGSSESKMFQYIIFFNELLFCFTLFCLIPSRESCQEKALHPSRRQGVFFKGGKWPKNRYFLQNIFAKKNRSTVG